MSRPASDRLPWFKCVPSLLLGALSGMQPDVGYLYVTILLRIYETSGPIRDSLSVLSRRTGMTERRVSSAFASLVEMGKISLSSDGLIDSITTHETLTAREELQNVAKKAGKASAEKRAQKDEQNQGKQSTYVDVSLNEEATNKTKNKTKNKIERESPSDSCRKQVSASVIRDAAKRFYIAYPKHVDPRAAEKKFETIVRSGVDPEHIIRAAERYAEAHRVAGTEKQFIPAPAVWLNKGSYDNEDLPLPRAGPAPGRSNGMQGLLENVLGNRDVRTDDSTNPRGRQESDPGPFPVLQLERERGREDG